MYIYIYTYKYHVIDTFTTDSEVRMLTPIVGYWALKVFEYYCAHRTCVQISHRRSDA